MCGYLDIMTMLFQYNQDLLSQEVVRYSFIRIRNILLILKEMMEIMLCFDQLVIFAAF